MSAGGYQEWIEGNQRFLSAALEQERAALAHYAGHEAPKKAATDGESQPPAQEMASPPALERLCAVFGMSPFERRLLLWCAGAELDAGFAQSLADAQGDASRRRPCFSLALAVMPEAHWSALTPASPLRYFNMIEPVPGQGLSSAPLQIDERILHY